jgi:hypothetical protein
MGAVESNTMENIGSLGSALEKIEQVRVEIHHNYLTKWQLLAPEIDSNRRYTSSSWSQNMS